MVLNICFQLNDDLRRAQKPESFKLTSPFHMFSDSLDIYRCPPYCGLCTKVGPTSHRGWPGPSEAPSSSSIHNSPWVAPLRRRRPERAGIISSQLVGLLIKPHYSETIIPNFYQSKSSAIASCRDSDSQNLPCIWMYTKVSKKVKRTKNYKR